MKRTALQWLGWLAVAWGALLAAAAIWGHVSLRHSFDTLPGSLAQTIDAATDAVAAMARTTRARTDLADDGAKTLHATRIVLRNLKTMAERQAAQLPQHEASLRGLATNTKEFADRADKAAELLSFEIPVLRSQPLRDQAAAVQSWADTGKRLAVSLTSMADSTRSDAVPFAKSVIELSIAGQSLIDDAEKGVAAVRAEHVPQAIATMEQAASTLRDVSAHASMLRHAPTALLLIVLSCAASVIFAGAALLIAAASIPPGQRVPT